MPASSTSELPPLPSVPAWHRRLATRATPLRLFDALYANETNAFLYESLEAHGQRGRYSFIGAFPRAVFTARGADIRWRLDRREHTATGNALDVLRGLIRLQSDAPPVAPFCGGAVGYLGYDVIRFVERVPDNTTDDLGLPDAYFLFPREIICFDHLHKLVHVILYQEQGHEQRLSEIEQRLERCEGEEPPLAAPAKSEENIPLTSNLTRARFEEMVEQGKGYIHAGDIFQVVLSQRFAFDWTAPPLRLYRALRVTNPSPYMYYLNLEGLQIVGSSPEVLVQTTGRRVVTRPLAGTRPRGADEAEDLALANDLRSDEKERAEHVMLVDLGRNDLGRVCDFGTVQVTDMLDIEYHSRVMHLVSNVEGWRAAPRDAIDVFAATFPAGTVSGAPKIRAMEIIDELEPTRRGVYAGAIGYFSLLGDLDFCIGIRTIVLRNGKGYIQAGAGIVADSQPAAEYEETLNKANALMRAVQFAAGDATF